MFIFRNKKTVISLAIVFLIISAFNYETILANVRKLVIALSSHQVKSINLNGALSYINFDECNACTTARDRSGNGKNLIYQSQTAAKSTTTPDGYIQNGGSFMNTQNQQQYAYFNPSPTVVGLSAFSVSAWFKATSSPNNTTIINQWNYLDPSQSAYKLAINSTGQPYFSIYNNSNSYVSATSSTAVSANTWYHLLGTYDGSNIVLYLNGIQVASSAQTGTIGIGVTTNYIGVEYYNDNIDFGVAGFQNYFTGIIDEIIIYNRALSADDVSSMHGAYQRSTIGFSQADKFTSGLLGYWSLNGKDVSWSANTATDLSGTGNTGRLVGFATSTGQIAGISGQALSFNGYSGKVNVDDAAGLDLTDAVSVGVWINKTVLTGATTTYDFNSSGTAGWERMGTGSSTSSPTAAGWLAASSASTTNISSSNNAWWSTATTTGHDQFDLQLYRFNLKATGSPESLSASWEGYGEAQSGYNVFLYIWNFTSSAWEELSNSFLSSDGTLTGAISGLTNYVSQPYIYLMAAARHYNYAPIPPADSVRTPANAYTLAPDVTAVALFQGTWTDRDGDTPQYLTSYYGPGVANCAGTPAGTSGWITGAFYTASGLALDTVYSWRTMARSGAGTYNDNSASSTCFYFSTQSSGGSCPYLYTWDGDEFLYHTDVFGMGILGIVAGKDGTKKPYPQDFYIVEADELREKDGFLDLRFTEEARELDYFDRLRLYTLEYDSDVDLIAEIGTIEDAEFGIKNDPQLHTVSRNPISPKSCVYTDRFGSKSDCLEKVLKSDGINLDGGEQEYLAWHSVELDFGNNPNAEQIRLIFQEGPLYPQTKPGIEMRKLFPVTVKTEIMEDDGTWVPVSLDSQNGMRPTAGFRMDIVDLTKEFVGKKQIKIRIYNAPLTSFDYLAVDVTKNRPVKIIQNTIVSADLSYGGLAEGVARRKGDMDYETKRDVPETQKNFAGYLTKYGDVMPLIAERDDKFVITQDGDEIRTKFLPVSEKIGDGKKRSYLVDAYGFYKNRKAKNFTRTVEPLPFSGMSNFPYDPAKENYPQDEDHQNYLKEWNTRYCPPNENYCVDAKTGVKIGKKLNVGSASVDWGGSLTAAQLPVEIGTAPLATVPHRSLNSDYVSVSIGSASSSVVALKNGAYGLTAGTRDGVVYGNINSQQISATLQDGWNYVVLTYDKNAGGSDQMRLYVNGSLASSAAYTTAISTNANNFVIGDAFTGTLDEVRLYNRALTPQEISDQYLLNKRGN